MKSAVFAAVAFASLAILFGVAAVPYAHRYSLSSSASADIYWCFLVLLIFVVLPAVPIARSRIASVAAGRKCFALLPIWLVPYLIYSAGTADFHITALLRLFIIGIFPLAFYAAAQDRRRASLLRQDIVVWIWLALAVLFHGFTGIWNVPRNLDFMGRLYMITVASWSWVFVRPVPELGYNFAVSLRTGRAVALNFFSFAAIGIPLSFALHFAAWNPRWHGISDFLLAYIEIFLFIAWLEELLFRGFLQTLLSKTMRSPVRAQLFASCLFGLAHIFHAPVPNWRYVILASIAGWFYGSAYRSGGNLLAAALTHALVDTVWRTWFTRS